MANGDDNTGVTPQHARVAADFWARTEAQLCEVGGRLQAESLPRRRSHARTWYWRFKRQQTTPYHRALLDRLQQLGYLPAEVSPASLTPAIMREAVRGFQQEARGLKVDGWLGPKTWQALQELFTFTEPLNPTHWLDDQGQPCPALLRAAGLRLKAYGLVPAHPHGVPVRETTAAALTAGLQLLHQCRGRPAPDDLATAGAIDQLFDHEAIVQSCAARSWATVRAPEFSPQAQRFLLSLIKVELWLRGYAEAPDGKTDLIQTHLQANPGGAHGPHWRTVTEPTNLTRNIRQFLQDTQADGTPAPPPMEEPLAPPLIAAMFQRLGELAARPELGAEDTAAETEAALQTVAASEEAPSLWAKVKTLIAGKANQLFDGIHRAWQWLKGKFGAVKDRLLSLARIVWARLTQIGQYIGVALRAFANGLSYLLNSDLPGSDVRQLAVSHAVDFDFRVFCHEHAEARSVDRIAQQLQQGALTLRVAGQLLGLVLATVQGILAGVSGAWLLVAGKLLSIWRQLVELGQNLIRLQELATMR